MSAIGKAKKFLELCKQHEWKGNFHFDHDQDFAKIEVARGGETLMIQWMEDQLMEAPHYSLGGIRSRLHCAATARRVVAGKPDMDLYLKRQRRANRAAVAAAPMLGAAQNNSASSAGELADDLEQNLPFDINEEGVDNEVLRFCRGSTLVWRNRFTGAAQMEFIPVDQNRDLKNVYYIGESADGRPYLSFMTTQGIFRAVAFDQMLQVR